MKTFCEIPLPVHQVQLINNNLKSKLKKAAS